MSSVTEADIMKLIPVPAARVPRIIIMGLDYGSRPRNAARSSQVGTVTAAAERKRPMKHWMVVIAGVVALHLLLPTAAESQAVGGAEGARPVAGDPGMSWMLVADQPEYRVLRDYAEPGATRRLHSHEATYHVLVVVTGSLRVTVEGESPVDVAQGEVLQLKGGVSHTFTNTGNVTATIVEVFGKAPGE
jgi:quercetin dioxygenase-like cupin family protein